MLKDDRLEEILHTLPSLTVAVVGDLFLDCYLDLDAALTEPSLETGLDAYQVTDIRPYAGAAGTVINNLVALGVGRIHAISFIGEDGAGFELRRALDRLHVVDSRHVVCPAVSSFFTPTYTKPMLHRLGQPPRELNRLDVKNRTPLPKQAAEQTITAMKALWPEVDALLVLDQVSEVDCGVVSELVREALARLGEENPSKVILADSRERMGLFRSVAAKPNQLECQKAIRGSVADSETVTDCAAALAKRLGRPVFCTCGERGLIVADPSSWPPQVHRVPAFPVTGPTDTVGAGDSTSAGIACALAAGASLVEAAAFGNLVASITIQQIGTTGTATPLQIRQRWMEIRATCS